MAILIAIAKPALSIMNLLRLRSKLLGVSVLAIVPLLFVAQAALQTEYASIVYTRGELQGSEIVSMVLVAISEGQHHRGLSNLAGPRGSDALAANTVKLKQALSAIDQAIAGAPELALDSHWQPARDALLAVAALPAGGEHDRIFDQHTAAVRSAIEFVNIVTEKSGLLLEPDAQPYFFMILSTERVPPWRELIAQLRGRGAAILRAKASTPDEVSHIGGLIREIGQATRQIEREVAALTRAGAEKPKVTSAAITAATTFAEYGRAQLLATSIDGDAEQFFARGTEAVELISSLQRDSITAMNEMLQERLSQTTRTFHIMVAVLCAAIAGMCYLLWGFYISFIRAVEQISESVHHIAAGDLKSKCDTIGGRDELADIGRDLELMTNSLSALVGNVRNSSTLAAQSGARLTEGTSDLSVRTEQQAASLEETSATVAQLAQTVTDNATTAKSVDSLAANASAVAETSMTAMSAAVLTMNAIESDANKVQDIISLIDGIAFQTNILSLNAAVEAARAGEQGRGFAVVAAEVRQLAQRSAAAAKDIKGLIDNSARQIRSGVVHINEVNDKMQVIVDSIRDVASNMGTLSQATSEQSTSLAEISEALAQLDTITQNNGAMVEQARINSNELEMRANRLAETVQTFRLRQGVAEEAQALVERGQQMIRQRGPAALEFITRDADQSFADRDLYLFALDRNGIYKAFAGKPERVGTSLHKVPGVDAKSLLQDCFAGPADRGFWVDYAIVNPTSGVIQRKSSYVERIAKDLVIGCGIYSA